MKFRTRLLILLLVTTMVPLGLSFLSQRASILHFGNKLAGETRTLLYDSAVTLLHSLVDDFDRILQRDSALALLTLQNQAQAVEYRLNLENPGPAEALYFNRDYNSPQTQPADMVATPARLRPTADGQLQPIPVSFSQQVIFLADGVKPAAVTDQLVRLSSMSRVYQNLHDIQPDLFLWQYTALKSGIHSSYPGKGGYPDNYDPRQRQWYQDAVEAGEPIQRIMNDLSTKRLILTLAQPIYRHGRELAGVTALDIDYSQFFADWQIPASWATAAESMMVIYHGYTQNPAEQLQVLLRNRSRNQHNDWRSPVQAEYLTIPEAQLRDIQRDFVTGQSAVRKVLYRGRETLWAYGSRRGTEPFPLVIVPLEQVLAKAVTAEHYVNQQIAQGLKISAVLTVFALGAAILLAMLRARKVTDPVTQLAHAATQLAAGDFDVKVDIRTADELRNLGNIFNSLGATLKEREQMKQSLALAKEIQQELLPEASPLCCGFQLTGCSYYCDETGGDYYDFIELGEKDSDQAPLGLAVGDVSGHGIGAALVMAAARSNLRSLAKRYPTDIDGLLSSINVHLCRDTSDAYFMTMFYGILNPAERSLRWCSAGHAPIFHYHDGTVHELQSSGPPLGILEGADYAPVEELAFAPGDILLVGTDGIWEANAPDGEMYGTERLHELLREHAAAPVESIAAAIIRELKGFIGTDHQDDDITLLIVKAD